MIAASPFGKTGVGIMEMSMVIVTGNFGQSVAAASATAAKIELSTDQERHIATAIDQLPAKANDLLPKKWHLVY